MSNLGGAGADPGGGARKQAARAAAQVQEAQRKLAEAQRRQAGWEAGAEGERRTAAVLAELATEGWQVLHDVHWPGRPFENIDHIVVGPAGVLVIDSKNWSGSSRDPSGERYDSAHSHAVASPLSRTRPSRPPRRPHSHAAFSVRAVGMTARAVHSRYLA